MLVDLGRPVLGECGVGVAASANPREAGVCAKGPTADIGEVVANELDGAVVACVVDDVGEDTSPMRAVPGDRRQAGADELAQAVGHDHDLHYGRLGRIAPGVLGHGADGTAHPRTAAALAAQTSASFGARTSAYQG